jgi:hypothetical protein
MLRNNARDERDSLRFPAVDDPVVVVPKQTSEAIRRRRDIRESFHDAQALTISPCRARAAVTSNRQPGRRRPPRTSRG